MKYTYIITMLLLLFSCNEDKVKKSFMDSFKEPYHLTGKQLSINPDKLNSAGKLILFDKEKCIIKECLKGEYTLEKIYYEEDSLIPLAHIGNGPNEYLQVRLAGKTGKQSFDFIDMKAKKIIRYNLSDSLLQSISLDRFTSGATSTSQGYVITGCLEEVMKNDSSRFSLLDNSGKFLNSFGKFPNDGNKAPYSCKLLAYQGSYTYNASTNRLAYVSTTGIIFEIYQLGNQPKLLKHYHELFPRYFNANQGNIIAAQHQKDEILGYTDICSTDKYIYALYSGKKPYKYKEIGMDAAKCSKTIHIYNWDGEQIGSYETDIDLLNITVSDDDKTLIAVTWKEDYMIHTFDLPNFH